MDEHDEMRSRTYPVKEDMAFQWRMWTVERVGRYGLCLLLLLTLAGLFSRGPLSWATLELTHATLEYDRFLRNGSHTDVTLDLHAPGAARTVAVLGGEALDAISLESIHPQAESMRTVRDGLELTFRADDTGHTRAHLSLGVNGLGLQRAYLRVGDDTVPFWIFIFP